MNKELIIDRYNNPKHKGKIAEVKAEFVSNTLCGDDITIYIKIENSLIIDAKYIASACSICCATADLLIDNLIGKNVKKINEITEKEVLKYIDMESNSPRLRCAILPLDAVKKYFFDVQ